MHNSSRDVVSVTGIPTSVDVQDVPVPNAPEGSDFDQPVDILSKAVITDSKPKGAFGRHYLCKR